MSTMRELERLSPDIKDYVVLEHRLSEGYFVIAKVLRSNTAFIYSAGEVKRNNTVMTILPWGSYATDGGKKWTPMATDILIIDENDWLISPIVSKEPDDVSVLPNDIMVGWE